MEHPSPRMQARAEADRNKSTMLIAVSYRCFGTETSILPSLCDVPRRLAFATCAPPPVRPPPISHSPATSPSVSPLPSLDKSRTSPPAVQRSPGQLGYRPVLQPRLRFP